MINLILDSHSFREYTAKVVRQQKVQKKCFNNFLDLRYYKTYSVQIFANEIYQIM